MKNTAFGQSLSEFPADETGRRLMKTTEYSSDKTRGTTRTLHQLVDDTLILTSEKWSHWGGEKTVTTSESVSWEELGPGGRFEVKLGVPDRGID